MYIDMFNIQHVVYTLIVHTYTIYDIMIMMMVVMMTIIILLSLLLLLSSLSLSLTIKFINITVIIVIFCFYVCRAIGKYIYIYNIICQYVANIRKLCPQKSPPTHTLLWM